MTVKSLQDAWKAVDEIFPTDYEKDEQSSANAGYPIFKSTADGCNAWISDLGCTLEVNLDDGRSIRVNIEAEPEITEEQKWSSSEIRNMCIDNDWYTAGDIRAYSNMLEYVDLNSPTKKDIFKVADDILKHSNDPDLTVEAIMFVIANDVVKTFYEVKGVV